MRPILLPLFALALPAAAQSPRFGAALSLMVPTGELRQSELSYTHPTYGPSTVREGYDTGLGAQFWVTLPANRTLAFRLSLGGWENSGTYDDPLYPRYNARASVFSLGADMQVFLESGAFTHKGTYLFGGISADFERYDIGYGDLDRYYDADIVDTTRKTRLGGTAGLGHSFPMGHGARFNFEVGYHATLQQRQAGDPPRNTGVKMGFGVVF